MLYTNLSPVCKVLLLVVLITFGSSAIVTVDQAPSLSIDDTVQFFYLEAPFPYNVPTNIKSAAGSAYNSYGVAYGGLGVWDTTSDFKFTIQLICNNYLGALFPSLQVDGELSWENQASVVFTVPVSTTDWIQSQLITTTSGQAYSQLIDWITDNQEYYASYQPITVLSFNGSRYNATLASDEALSSVDTGATEVLLIPQNSFNFLHEAIQQLANFGCDLGSFLTITAVSFDYFSANDNLPYVSWTPGTPAPSEVYNWYANLEKCYNDVFEQVDEQNLDATGFLDLIPQCYENSSVAYVYRTDTSVYNITLLKNNSVVTTPMLTEYQYDLPPSVNDQRLSFSGLDYFVMALALLSVLAGMFYCTYQIMCGMKKRRRISFEGERIASKTVSQIVGEGDEDLIDYYFGSRKSLEGKTLANYFNFSGKKSLGEPLIPTNKSATD